MSIKWSQPKSLFLTRILIYVIFCMLIAGIVIIPICTEWYDAVSGQPPIAMVLNICGYLCDAIGFVAIIQLHRLLGNIRKQEIFTEKNVTCLRIIAWCCFGIAIVCGVLGFWRSLAWLITFAAGFFGLLMRVLKNVFSLAVELRQENDYTI